MIGSWRTEKVHRKYLQVLWGEIVEERSVQRRGLEGSCENWSEVTDLQEVEGSSELQASGTASMKVMI